jgi:hypothetical protein
LAGAKVLGNTGTTLVCAEGQAKVPASGVGRIAPFPKETAKTPVTRSGAGRFREGKPGVGRKLRMGTAGETWSLGRDDTRRKTLKVNGGPWRPARYGSTAHAVETAQGRGLAENTKRARAVERPYGCVSWVSPWRANLGRGCGIEKDHEAGVE